MTKKEVIAVAKAAGWEYTGKVGSGRHEFTRGRLSFSFCHGFSNANTSVRFAGVGFRHSISDLMGDQGLAFYRAHHCEENLRIALDQLAALDHAAIKAAIVEAARMSVEGAEEELMKAKAHLALAEVL